MSGHQSGRIPVFPDEANFASRVIRQRRGWPARISRSSGLGCMISVVWVSGATIRNPEAENPRTVYSQPFAWMNSVNALSFSVTGGSHIPMNSRFHTGFPDHGSLNVYL